MYPFTTPSDKSKCISKTYINNMSEDRVYEDAALQS